VGLGDVRAPGEAVTAGQALAVVHAADEAGAVAAVAAVRAAMSVTTMAPSVQAMPVLQRVRG
jgi:thymidine phosphorylase